MTTPLALLVLGACTGATRVGSPAAEPAVTSTTSASSPAPEAPPMTPSTDVTQGINATAVALYAQLSAGNGNVFFSPASVQVALGMTAAGARGATLEAMQTALHLPDSPHASLGALVKGWNATGDASPVQLAVANRLWVQTGMDLVPAYEQLTADDYGAGVGRLDFATEGDAARAPINAWVEENTQRRIKDLLPGGSVTPATRMVLTNAVYFKADWAQQFDADRTQSQPFTTLDGTTVDAMLMTSTVPARYAQADGAQIALVPYKGDSLDLLVVLPDAPDGLPALEATLSVDVLDAWVDQTARRDIQLMLPRFETTIEYRLAGPLAAMGMGEAFTPSADFSGMTDQARLSISEVVHKAFVTIDEEGTEAAAATGVVMRTTSLRPPDPLVRCDHPFLFAIRDRASGTLLFVGRMADPTG